MNIGYKLVSRKNKKLYSYVNKKQLCLWSDNGGVSYPIRYIKNRWSSASKKSFNDELFVFDTVRSAVNFLLLEMELDTSGRITSNAYRLYKCEYIPKTFSNSYNNMPHGTVMAEKVKLVEKIDINDFNKVIEYIK